MAIALDYQQVYSRRSRKVLVPVRYQVAAAVLLFVALLAKVWIKIECTEIGYQLAKARQETVLLDMERRELELHRSVLLKPDNLVMRGRKKLGLAVLNPNQAVRLFY